MPLQIGTKLGSYEILALTPVALLARIARASVVECRVYADNEPIRERMRRMKGRRIIAIVLLVQCLSSPARAQSSDWAVIEGLASGVRVIVVFKTGTRVEGNLQSALADGIGVVPNGAGLLRIARNDVREIFRVDRDSVANGILLGAAAGAAFGVFFGFSGRTFECKAGCSITIGTTLFTPIGALIGYMKDKRHNATVLIYRTGSVPQADSAVAAVSDCL